MLDLENMPVAKFPVPNIGQDLIQVEGEGWFQGMPNGPVLAALELLRHDEISLPQAAALIGITTNALTHLLARLPITEFNQIVRVAGYQD